MPHIIVKMYPGRTEEQKQRLSEAITNDVAEIAKCDKTSISITIEEIDPQQWPEKVYRPDILDQGAKLYRKPGYNPFE